MPYDSDFSSLDADDDVLQLLREMRREQATMRRETQDRHTENTNRLNTLEADLKNMRSELEQNTAMTATVKDVMTTTRVATAVIKWVGAIALALGSIWWAIKEIAGRGGNITPGP
jgi:predicted translin family RNA/ssDNA-binding protein